MAPSSIIVGSDVRLSYIGLSSIYRSIASSTARRSASQFRRTDYTNQGYTGSYDPDQKTLGPLSHASNLGAPKITPKVLKHHLDQFVVGQERAKKVLSVAVYNHYQRIDEAQRQEEEGIRRLEERLQRARSWDEGQSLCLLAMNDGHFWTEDGHLVESEEPSSSPFDPPVIDISPLTLDKANVLLLGPSGVGKTLMAKTLARVLAVPFSMSDCTPFTQAGYIGEDAEVCVQRLLAAADYDVAQAERGIIFLDEVDKIKTARDSHGKDVGGEGVQQALLKIIEGATLQIQAKQEKSSSMNYSPTNLNSGGASSPSSNSSGSVNTTTGPAKAETYNVRTNNILFIFAGAFVGLQKLIMNRIAKGSIGFGSPIRSSISSSSSSNAEASISVKKGSEESIFFEKHLPFFSTASPDKASNFTYNPLDLVEPTDLQTYGLIPELIGRIPVSAALSALDEDALVRVLTEPRNSLIRQYEQLFSLSGVELYFTRGALREVAKSSLGMGTGARGLRTCCERLLTDAMFEMPGKSSNGHFVSC